MLDPMGLFSASLIVSLVLWLPSMLAAFHGKLGLPAAGIRYLVAFVLCRFAFGFIGRLVTTYHLVAQARAATAQAAEADAKAQAQAHNRRRDDQAA